MCIRDRVRDEVTDLLLDFARDENHSILISSHIVSDLEKLCDTIAFLHLSLIHIWIPTVQRPSA